MENQAPNPNLIEPESGNSKKTESYPAEHISSIIERSQFAPAVGSILAQESISKSPEIPDAKPVELESELSHEVKDQPIPGPIAPEQPEVSLSSPKDKNPEFFSTRATPVPSSLDEPDTGSIQPVQEVSKTSLKPVVSIYKQAILGGVAAAIALIIAFVVFSLVNN